MDDPSRAAARVEATDVCALTFVRRVAALLDQDPSRWEEGMALPRGWEFVLFTPVTRQSDLRPDGHHYAAPDPGGRLVLGGRRSRYLGEVRIGEPVRRTEEIVGDVVKPGSGAPLRIVTRRYLTYAGASASPAIEEEEDMVYRPADPSPQPAASARPAARPLQPAAVEPYRTDESMLFRYSALTNNAHRIHYDRPFATGAEGYPGLVVNGGLTALMLVEAFRRHAGREPQAIATRMARPLFCGEANRIALAQEAAGWRVWAETPTGDLAAQATIR